MKQKQDNLQQLLLFDRSLPMMQYALYYAEELGLAVIPLGDDNGKNPGAFTEHGCAEATRDPEQIRRWWEKHPTANIGVVGGEVSGGLVILDLDVPGPSHSDKMADGVEALRDWEAENGKLPQTWQDCTPSGGSHVFFRDPFHSWANKLEKNEPLRGIGVRTSGECAAVPPSISIDGKPYCWDVGPDEQPIFTEAEGEHSNFLKLMEAIHRTEPKKKSAEKPREILEGCRGSTLISEMGTLARTGMDPENVIESVWRDNLARCQPPFSREEFDRETRTAQRRIRAGEWSPAEETKAETLENMLPTTPEEHTAHFIEVQDELEFRQTDGKLKATLQNVVTVLERDKDFCGLFRYNEFTGKIEVREGAPWRRYNSSITDRDLNMTRLLMERRYGFTSAEKISTGIDIVAHQHPFHPIRDFLNSLEWDGGHYIEDLLPRYLGCEKNGYTTACMKLTMLGAISRAFHPGCKFDYCVTLCEPKQGGGKSSFVRLLAMKDDWFSDSVTRLDDGKAVEKIQSKWILEFSEMLATMNAKTAESVKSFLSVQVDTYREPYARFTTDRYRQCIFIGTTNDLNFLPDDKTGNRRFLPVRCHSDRALHHPLENEDETREFIRKAWGEAMAIYRSGDYSLTLPREYEDVALALQREHTPEDPRIGEIQAWLDHYNGDSVCSIQLFQEALGNRDIQPKVYEAADISRIMNSGMIKGWCRHPTSDGKRRFGKYGKQRAWDRVPKRSEAVPSVPTGFEEVTEGGTPFDPEQGFD